jgi:ferritin
MQRAADEEQAHADLIGHYIVDRGEAPTFASIEPVVPPSGDDLLPYFEAALAREQATTESLKELYFLAEKMGDEQTCSFIECPSNGFVGFFAEQTKSEREIIDIMLMLRRLDNNGRVFYDEQIGEL